MQNTKNENKKKNVLTITVVGVAVILLALAFIFFLEVMPGISAKSDFNKKVEAVAEGNVTAATVFSPRAQSGIFAETAVEKTLYDTGELRALFLSATEKVSFAERGKELSPNDFDYRIRFYAEREMVEFFVKGSSVYYVEGDIRYYFMPKNANEFDALVKYLNTVITSN